MKAMINFSANPGIVRRTRMAGRKSGRASALAVCVVLVQLLSVARGVPVQLLSARAPAVALPSGGNDNSVAPVLSPDGRFVVFASAANDLAPGGNNFYCLNVYLRDRTYNTTVLVSGNTNGTGGGNGPSMLGQASAYGRYVVFQSAASDLVPGDTNGVSDIFLRDTFTGTTRLISVAANGGFASGASTDPVMTPDGTCVAFISAATNLVAGDTNGIPDVFVRDLIMQTTWRVSVNAHASASSSTNPVMATPVITPDGRYVAFFSSASDLEPSVPSGSAGEVYVRDRLANTTTWASTNAAAMVSAALGLSGVPAYHPRLSDDGRYVAFKAGSLSPTGTVMILQFDKVALTTTAVSTNDVGWYIEPDDNMGPEMTPDGRFIAFVRQEGSVVSSNFSSVHLWDAQGGVDTLVSDNGSGVPTNTTSHTPAISSDGRYVAFLSNATNLVANAVSNGFHVYLRDLQSSTTQLVDADTNGVGSTDETMTSLGLSADGRYVAFSSPDGRLVSGDKNRAEDVFVRDTVGVTTELISQHDATVPLQAGNAGSLSSISLSADGRWAAFASVADDLVPNDTNRAADVFVRDLVNGTNVLVSVGLGGGSALSGVSHSPVISTNGRYVAFISSACNLTADAFITNGPYNVFRRDLQTGTTVLVSAGTNALTSGNYDSTDPVISPDGRYVAFLSGASNLVAGVNSGTFWRDVDLGQTVGMKGPGTFKPSLSSNGRYVAYSTNTSLRIRDTQLGTDIYTNAGAVVTAAIEPTGTKIVYETNRNASGLYTLYVENIAPRSNLFSMTTKALLRNAASWSDDGRWLTFVTTTNLGGGDDGINKVYLQDFLTGTLSLIGLAGPGTNGAAASSEGPVISGDGRLVAYRCVVTNTVIGDITAPPNLFLLDRATGSNTVLTAGPAVPGSVSWISRPVISDGGAMVAFFDAGSRLASGDLNRTLDAYGASVDVNAALVDSDSDGIPDWWLVKYFGHATGQEGDLSRASDDADGDGVSNLNEYYAGMSPVNSASVFRLWSDAPVDSTMALTWPAVMGKSYQVEYKTNLTDSVWLTAPGNVWVTGGQGYYLAPAAQPHTFYRVLVTH
jgi:Tol biopolymer transport system component